MCGLSMACLWPGFDLDLDSLGAGFGVVLCLGGGKFCVACDGYMCGLFCGHLLCLNWL